MKTIEIKISDLAYEKLKGLSDKLQISMGDVIDNPLSDGFVNDYYEEEIKRIDEYEASEDRRQENFWLELREERRLQR